MTNMMVPQLANIGTCRKKIMSMRKSVTKTHHFCKKWLLLHASHEQWANMASVCVFVMFYPHFPLHHEVGGCDVFCDHEHDSDFLNWEIKLNMADWSWQPWWWSWPWRWCWQGLTTALFHPKWWGWWRKWQISPQTCPTQKQTQLHFLSAPMCSTRYTAQLGVFASFSIYTEMC